VKIQSLTSAIRVLSALTLLSTVPVIAQDRLPVHYSGVLNDDTPNNPNISGSPYEMHGQWSLDLNPGDTANFYADITMSDFGTTSTGAIDPTQGGQGAHTHHIRLTNARVIHDMIGCPTYSPVATTGFQITGTVSQLTGNGGQAPFESVPPSSTLQVCITGGIYVTYANMAMVFGGRATNHFGTQAIHGVVREAKNKSGESLLQEILR
jgi:hypothetical protein